MINAWNLICQLITLQHSKTCYHLDVITLPQSGNHILDIRPVMLLTEEERKAEDFLVLGVAQGYGEACEVVRTMVDDMYRHTDGFNWKSYMSYLGETR